MKILIWDKRSEQGISLKRLSSMTKISKAALNNYENEKTSPNLINLEKIAKALDCKMSDLFESEYN